jgi:hypothetical protein
VSFIVAGNLLDLGGPNPTERARIAEKSPEARDTVEFREEYFSQRKTIAWA